ncbi:hypothetical protein K493DRAFT_321005 [Basidiobolus meristosporus CBS 931.73]|uniref:EI24-domain-containing protein n=1 Tax=Basidiobolus meristosporus CBS 931.73 TaxID=1314790 RepID=A0A1Y1X1L2_9FUNG|nr:hypothetical protein K493DRAFT_321005 [Basidiobolus meristosporus CBS 931.73]|eukprot:ORX79701.1 hypothetical protein K493DRAFT_321005 [Basidiobolus meristosporus CBS 931.73]
MKCIWALLTTLLVALCSLIGFGFLISPQAHGLIRAGCPVWLAWVVSVIFYLLESLVFVLLFSLIALPFFQDSLFDYVLVLRGYKRVLENEHAHACSRGFRAGIGYLLVQILLLVFSIPINLIPLVGTYFFCYLNGFVLAWGYQIHNHIDIKGMSFYESKSYVFRHKRQFSGFGTVAFALEMIPLFNFFFIFSNTIGAALWAADEYASAERNLPISANDAPPASNVQVPPEQNV